MNEGYVYILSNRSMPGLVKIGQTRRSPEERAREMSRNTSIPADFVVEFEVFTSDRLAVEGAAHERLGQHRFSKTREFFQVEIDTAAEVLMTEADKVNAPLRSVDMGSDPVYQRYEAVQIADKLRDKFPGMIREEI